MTSALNTKINSYAIERGIEMSETYSSNPTRTGSVTPVTNAYGVTNTSYPPIYESSVGPSAGAGSWKFNFSSTASSNTRLSTTSVSTEYPGVTDGDWVFGFWFSFSKYPAVNNVIIASIGNSTANGVTINYNGSTNSITGNRGKFSISTAGGLSTTYSSNTITDTGWHYIAVRRVTSPSIMYYLYIDGAQVASASGTSTTASTTWSIGSSSTQTDNYTINISNYHFGTSSVLDATAIAEIWTAGNAINKTITETPATASANQIDPTISVSTGSHTEITTSIIVNAEFPSSISILGQSNIEIHPDVVPTANIEMINNVDISTGSDVSWSTLEMTASAILVEPQLPIAPFTASAQSGNHTVYVTPNYYSLVRQSNPYIYYYDGLASTSINGGYQTGTFARGTQTTQSDAGVPLNLIGSGKSWNFAATSNADNYLDFTAPSTATSFAQNILNGECSIELWYKPTDYPSYVYGYWTLFKSEGLEIRTRASSDYTQWTNGYKGALEIVYKQGNTILSTYTSSYGHITTNNLHHIVVTITAATAGNIQITGWIDGTAVISLTRAKTSWTVSDASVRFGSAFGYNNSGGMGPGWIDEIALYSNKLSNSEIITHYSFINESSPNRNISAEAINVNAESGNHSFTTTSNINIPSTSITTSSLFVQPIIIASKVINIITDSLTASALNTNVTIKWGWTIYATPAISYAESVNAYRLNDIYYNYVQANVSPYRYVTFDGNNSYLDYGSDNDYAVIPTVVGGTIVNPDEGINGKSAKTGGTSYITDGVILKESEYNDTWGTGLNNYHSSFWIQRAPDDTSTTGLRVLWNLNGYADNQHVILYQYQNKLTLQFNNGSGTHITQSTTSNYDLFDGQRHFVAVAFDHTGSNNYVNLFIDAIDVMQVNLGTYNGTTINGTTPVGANDEANNHPRLSVGCLITPFAATALPVVPTNTKIYVDEVIWAKSSLTPTLATNLFNIMPVKGQAKIYATPLTASDEFIVPTISTNSVLTSGIATGSIELLDVTIYTERESANTADIIDVSAGFVMPSIFEDRLISADIFVATATFNSAGVIITIPGGPMTANAYSPHNVLFGTLPLAYRSSYIRYLRTQSLSTAIFGMREVK
jgi:hypothetical protein